MYLLCVLRVLYLINQNGCLNLPTSVNLLTETNAGLVDRPRLTEADRRGSTASTTHFKMPPKKIVVVS